MYRINKGKKLLAMLLAAVLLAGLFPMVYAEEPAPETPVEDVTSDPENNEPEVTEPDPTEAPAPESTLEPTFEPTPETTPELTSELPPEPTPEPTPEEDEATPEEEPSENPGWDPDAEDEDEDEEEEFEDEEDFEEDDNLVELDDDDPGTVSSDLLEQFNNPDTFEHVEFAGTADIILKEESYSYGDTVTLIANVSGFDISYRLVWEATDYDERGWYTIGSGTEYSFTVTEDIMERGYRVVLFAVD